MIVRLTAKPGPDDTDYYPTSDGKPMAETDVHRDNMADLIEMLKERYRSTPRVYVSGNLLIFYDRANRRRHVSPDVFVAFDVPKPRRKNYLLWMEGKGPDVVIEVTSESTHREDLRKKFELYRKVLRVPEYFLFDPYGEYLHPPLQGHYLVRGRYVPIKPVAGRLPSKSLGLHLEPDGEELRLFDPDAKHWLLPARERIENVEQKRKEAEEARQREAEARQREAEARQRAESEITRLRRELEESRRRST